MLLEPYKVSRTDSNPSLSSDTRWLEGEQACEQNKLIGSLKIKCKDHLPPPPVATVDDAALSWFLIKWMSWGQEWRYHELLSVFDIFFLLGNLRVAQDAAPLLCLTKDKPHSYTYVSGLRSYLLDVTVLQAFLSCLQGTVHLCWIEP